LWAFSLCRHESRRHYATSAIALREETTQIVFDFLHLAVIFYTVIGWRFLIDIPENFVNYQESDVEQEYVGEFESPVKIYRTFGVRAAKSFFAPGGS